MRMHDNIRKMQSLTIRLFVIGRSALSNVFTALHAMQTRSSDENSVCLSVCQMRDLWQKGRKIGPDFYIIRQMKTFCILQTE